MSMVLEVRTISDRNVERLLADPPLIWRVVAPDDPEIYEEARAEAAKPGFLARLFGGKRDPGSDFRLAPPEGAVCDLEKAWHGVHYLLTGRADEGSAPLDFLLAGGRDIGTIEVGYGPARVFTAAETGLIRDAIRRLADDDLRARFDPEKMLAADIYPRVWDEGDEARDWLIDAVASLRELLDAAVAAKLGLVVTLQ
jgi:hypothetical protein